MQPALKHQKKDIYLHKKDKKLLMNEDQYNNLIIKSPKIANLLDYASSNQPSKFKTKNWVQIHIHVKGKITIIGTGDDAAARQADQRDRGVAFKNCAPFTICISEINNIQIDNCEDIDIIMSMYNLIEYSDNYAKKHLEICGNIT